MRLSALAVTRDCPRLSSDPTSCMGMRADKRQRETRRLTGCPSRIPLKIASGFRRVTLNQLFDFCLCSFYPVHTVTHEFVLNFSFFLFICFTLPWPQNILKLLKFLNTCCFYPKLQSIINNQWSLLFTYKEYTCHDRKFCNFSITSILINYS